MNTWTTKGFEAFRRGSFGNSGQNLYVSKQGILQRIYQYDLNRDGYFDLVFANCQNHSECAPSYLYTLDGTCTELPGQGSLSALTADLTGNGYQDILIAGYYALLAPYVNSNLYYGSDQGYSENNHICLPTPFAEDCCSGDFTGNGKAALAFAMPEYATIRIFYQTELGFEFDGYTDVSIKANLIAAADLDGDGYCDLLACETNSTEITIYWGSKDGISAENKTVLSAASDDDMLAPEEEKVLTSEMEKKFPTPRLLKTAVYRGKVCLIRSTGKYVQLFTAENREFKCILSADVPMAIAAAIGDIDGDGYDDIAIASQLRDPTDSSKQQSFILWGDSDGFDKRPRTIISTAQACDVDVYNGMVLFCQASVGRSYQNNSLLFRYPDFEKPQHFISQDARRASFVRNPHETLIFIQSHFSRSSIGFQESYVYFGGEDGYSPDRSLKVPGHCAVDALIADLDDDGWAELLIANNAENSIPLDPGHHIHHFGPNGFEPERSTTIKTDLGWGVVVGDFNHDGYLEIVTPCDWWKNLRIYYGRDNFCSYDTISLDGLGSPRWISAVDVNGDGWLDIICPLIDSNRTLILWGGPDGFSVARSMQLAVRNGSTAQAADLTHNGYPDIIIGAHTDTPTNGKLPDTQPHHSFLYIYWNGPDGISESRKCLLRADSGDSIAVADFNNDGWLDIFVGSYHNGVDRDTPSFLYWNRGGKFKNLDKKLLFTHSASGCIAADFNRDGHIDLAVANHKIFGDHHGKSWVWWNGKDGFLENHITELPTEGPHGMISVNPGNILDRSENEYYISEPYNIDFPCFIAEVKFEGEIPHGTNVDVDFSVNGGEWRVAGDCTLCTGDSLRYRLTISAELCLRTPRISAVQVVFAE